MPSHEVREEGPGVGTSSKTLQWHGAPAMMPCPAYVTAQCCGPRMVVKKSCKGSPNVTITAKAVACTGLANRNRVPGNHSAPATETSTPLRSISRPSKAIAHQSDSAPALCSVGQATRTRRGLERHASSSCGLPAVGRPCAYCTSDPDPKCNASVDHCSHGPSIGPIPSPSPPISAAYITSSSSCRFRLFSFLHLPAVVPHHRTVRQY